MMKKIDRKGFTLVELLTVIIITSLVLIVAVYGVFKVKDDAKEKSVKLSLAGIKSSANIYSNSAPSSEWRIEEKNGKSFEYFCVTIGELMNKGIIDKNSLLPKGYDKETFLFVKRNILTKDILGEFRPEEYDDMRNICNGHTIVDNELIAKYPKITGYKAYTDKLEVNFEKGNIFSLNEDDTKTELETTYSCEVGTNSRNMSSNNTNIVGNKCIITELDNNTPYIVRIIMKSDNTIAPTDGNARTADFNNVIFNKESNQVINVKFNPKDNKDNIINPYFRYFKSSLNATSSVTVKECDSSLNCNGNTTNIVADKWYLSSVNEFNLNYELPENDVKVYITARMKDSRNIKEQLSEEFTILADAEPPHIEVINMVNGVKVENPDNWFNKDIDVNVKFWDDKSGINPSSLEYSLDNETFTSLNNTSDSLFIDKKIDNQNNKLYYKICDNAGNCNINSTNVKIDKILPVISFGVESGSETSSSSIEPSCSDEGSGVKKAPSKISFDSNSGSKKSKCIDNAGNIASKTLTYNCNKCTETVSVDSDNCRLWGYHYGRIKCGNKPDTTNFNSGSSYGSKDAAYNACKSESCPCSRCDYSCSTHCQEYFKKDQVNTYYNSDCSSTSRSCSKFKITY